MSCTRHLAVLLALEAISHGDTSSVENPTNIRLFMRHTQLVDGAPMRVPDISENSLRSVIFRRTLADHLVESLGIEDGSLPQPAVNLLYAGGNLARGSAAPGNEIELGHKIRELYPSLHLLGGATDSFVLPKSALSLAAWPVAREFSRELSHVAPHLAEEAQEVSIFDLLSEETRTRGTSSESSGNQMLYTYETLASGTKIVLEMTLAPRTPPAVEGALSLALSHWDGYFGGQGRQGRGRMALLEGPGADPAPYLEHLEKNAGAMRQGLLDGTLGSGKVVCAPEA